MEILTMYGGAVNPRDIERAAAALRDGKIIIYPTDTLYAIGCDALNNRAIERICRIKDINPAKQRLSIVCSGLSQASDFVRIDNYAYSVLRRYLPGPFTFILPASTRLPKVFKGHREAGVRIPDCPIATALAEEMGGPLLSTSINYDENYPLDGTDPHIIAANYEHVVDMMIDGGEGSLEPSTVVDLTDSRSPELVRQGRGIFDE